MKVLSLFTGIGGFDLGLIRAGMEIVGMCEIDKACQSVLRRHNPGVPIYDDVRSIGVNTHERGSVDLICGGFPCQDLSVAGKRAGLVGERSGLWFEFYRIVDELKPQWVIVENVPGLLSSNRGKDFAVILRGLVELRYGVCWRVLDSQYFGVPQRRRRVFIVASLGDGRAAEVLFEREGSGWNTAPSREAGERVARDTPSAIDAYNNSWTGEVTHTIQAGMDGHGQSPHTIPLIAFNPQSAGDMRMGVGDMRMGVGDIPTALQTNQRSAIAWHGAQITSPQNTGGVFEDVTPTVNGDARLMTGVRRLTPTECERLQGFPDGWTDGQSDSQRYKQLGNAVTVPVIEWIGRRIHFSETNQDTPV